MAVTFSDLHSEAGLKSLESYLIGKTYIFGNEITKDDVKVYAAVLDKPNSDLYPCASKWFLSVAAKLATSFPGKAVGVSISAQASSTEADPVKEVAAKDDDDLDLFVDETEEEKAAAEARFTDSEVSKPLRGRSKYTERENQCFIVLLSGALFQPHRRRDILSFMSITKRVFKGVEIFDQREHLKMEMEIPCSNKIKFITACSFSNDSFEDIMKAQVSVIKASATLNIQAFKIKKSVSISFRMTQVHTKMEKISHDGD
ncbi:elongation factor 1-beta 2-like protein [Tanacetum coccineum]